MHLSFTLGGEYFRESSPSLIAQCYVNMTILLGRCLRMLRLPSHPSGFEYLPDWVSQAEEEELLRNIRSVSFNEIRMHGVIAKRQVVHFGWDYGYESWHITPTHPIPAWLTPIRGRVSALMGREPEAVEQALISQYPPGAGIGWHRDAPMFGPIVVGISLLGRCRMRFQRMHNGRRETAEYMLDPRSAYILGDAARLSWQHGIPPTKEWRYSLTFRTLKKGDLRGRESGALK
jgi:DNA oxidative demethylase